MLAPFGSDGHKDVVKHSVGAAEKADYRQYDVELHHILGYLSWSSPDTSDSCFALPAVIEDSLEQNAWSKTGLRDGKEIRSS